MSNSDTAAERTGTVLHFAEPQLFVADIDAACAFYTGKLGFAVGFTYGEPPYYGQVVRDRARLNLRRISPPPVDPRVRDERELLSATIVVDKARPLFLEYQAAGVTFAHGLRTEPWGACTFLVRDPDGNLILFSGNPDPGVSADPGVNAVAAEQTPAPAP
jgi:catechol 2,3-dioxygenase-like lactoylglutathione lyase family enzyme